jgi:hypothetical protein
MATERQIAANRANAQKYGPENSGRETEVEPQTRTGTVCRPRCDWIR